MAEWKHGAAGTVSGILTRCTVAPLDVIKIRLQLQVIERTGGALGGGAHIVAGGAGASGTRKYNGVLRTLQVIVREEGALALWKGNWTAELLWGSYMGTQFMVYKTLQKACAGHNAANRAPGGQAGVDMASGAASGAVATALTYPLDLLRTRLAAQQEPRVYRGLWDAIGCVVRQEGALKLYAGLVPSLVSVVPYMGIQFSVYEACRRRARKWRTGLGEGERRGRPATGYERLPRWTEPLGCGVVAGMFSKLCTLPLDVTKKRMQVLSAPAHASWRSSALPPAGPGTGLEAGVLGGGAGGGRGGVVAMWREMLRREGVAVFFSGGVPSVLKTALASGMSFCLYEAGVALLDDAS